MTPQQMQQVRPRLEAFAAQLLGGLARADQRATGELYVRGLLLDGQRKSMQPMAARLGVDHQRLQQFVTSSTWDDAEVRERLARWAAETIGPDAFVVDDVGFAKDGRDSPGVARMYSGTLGKTGNCQIGVSVHLVTDRASAAVDWRLFVPESWDDRLIDDPVAAEEVRRRRARCKIGDRVRYRPKWQLALDMLDELRAWGLPGRPVVADAGYGDTTAFRLGLDQRGLGWVVAVKPTTSAHPGDAVPVRPPYQGRGRPPTARYPDDPTTLRTLTLAAGRGALKPVTWRHGTRTTKANPTAKLRSRFLALRVRPANRDIPRTPGGSLPACWLLAEWPPGEPEPTDYWLSNLDQATPLAEQPRPGHATARVGPPGQDSLADRARLPRTQARPGSGPLRRPQLRRLAPPRHPRRGRASLLHPAAPGPKSPCAGLSLYAVLRELQTLLAVWAGACHTCYRPLSLTPT